MTIDIARGKILSEIEAWGFRLQEYDRKVLDKNTSKDDKERFKKLIKATQDHVLELKESLKHI